MPKKVSTPPHVKGIIVNDEYVVFVCGSVQATLAVKSVTDESIFVSHCIPCCMRTVGRCSGGTDNIRRGNCYALSYKERQNLVNKTYYIPVTLPPHFWIYSKGDSNSPRIFTTAVDQSKENDIRLEALWLGNTYNNGIFCLGDVLGNEEYDQYDPWSTYEFYFKGIRNNDLNSTQPYLDIRSYLENYSLDKQREYLKSEDYTRYCLSNFINYETDTVLPVGDYLLKRRSKTGIRISKRYYVEV